MSKLNLIWIIGLFLLFTPIAYALQGGSSNSYSTDATRYIFYHNFNFTGQTSDVPNEELGSIITEVNQGSQLPPVYNWSIQSNALTASEAPNDGTATKLSNKLNEGRVNFSFELMWKVNGSLVNQFHVYGDNSTSTIEGGANNESFLLQMSNGGSIRLRDGVFDIPTAWDKPTNYALLHNMSLVGVVMFKNETACSINFTAFNVVNKTGILTYVQNGSQGEHTCGANAINIRNIFLRVTGDALGGFIVVTIDEFVMWNGTGARPSSTSSDTTLPIVNATINNTSPKINDFINITANVTDETGLSFCRFVDNQSLNNGALNYINKSISGTADQCSQNYTIRLTRGNIINFSVVVNDTSNNLQQNSTLITVANTIPNATNFVNTTGKHYNKNITRLNWTACNEPDGDVCRYIVFSDTNNPPVALYYNGTDLNISTNWTSDNTYFFRIKVMDDISESALSPVFNLTLDIGLPTLTANCTNNTITRFNQTCLFSIEDPFPYNLSVEVHGSNGSIHSKTNSTSFGRFINITLTLNLTEDGNYTIYVNASDSDKTSPPIKDKLQKQKQAEETHIYTDTERSIRMDLNLEFENTVGDALPLPSNLKTFSEFNSKGTHLEFGLNFTTLNQSTLPIFNIKTINVSLFYLNSTGFNNFVWKPYGIDFEGELKINNEKKDYGIQVKKVGQQNNYQVILIPNETLNVGDNVTFISTSIFGLNVIDLFYNVVNDQTHQNITRITPLNNTFANTNVNFTANITETNPDTMELWINSTGTWHLNRTASYENNITANFSLFSLKDGIYLWTVCANDTAGGRSCFAENYTITIDTANPSITLEIPFNNTVMTAGEQPNVNFRISSNETAKNCSLFLSGGIVGNESTQKQSHNFTIPSIAGGNYKWNATCYDLANNLGASGIFNLEIKIVSGGSGSISEPAWSSGGIGIPTLIEEEEIIDKGYTMTYICGKIKKFLNNTPNYDLRDIVLLQEDIRFEINFVIPFTTLKGYADNYGQFCEGKKKAEPMEFNSTSDLKKSLSTNQDKGFFDFDNYIKFPILIDLGKQNINSNKNIKGFFDFINLLFPLSISDNISNNPNVVWEGKIRILTIIVLSIIIITAIFINRYYKLLNKVIEDGGDG